MYGMSLLAIVVSKDVLQYDAVTEQLARVDELLLVGTLDGGGETKNGTRQCLSKEMWCTGYFRTKSR